MQAIDNRRIARLAKLAGAPDDKAAGVDLHVAIGDQVARGQPVAGSCRRAGGAGLRLRLCGGKS